MTKSEARKLIQAVLDPIVGPAGFRYSAKEEGFVRKIDGGKQILGLPMWDHEPRIEFSLTMCIRLEAVQAIVNEFMGVLPRHHAVTPTSITQLEHLGLTSSAAYRATSEAEMARALALATTLLRDRVLPFFERHRDLERVDRGLNPEPAATRWSWLRSMLALGDASRRAFDGSPYPYRAMTGITVACLAGNPRYPTLVQFYRRKVRILLPNERERYERLVAHLATLTA